MRPTAIVHLKEGICGRGARACLKHQVIISGSNRVLQHILVDPHRPDWDLMGA